MASTTTTTTTTTTNNNNNNNNDVQTSVDEKLIKNGNVNEALADLFLYYNRDRIIPPRKKITQILK